MSIRSSPTGTAAAPQGDRLKTVLSAGLGRLDRLSLHCTPCNDPMHQTDLLKNYGTPPLEDPRGRTPEELERANVNMCTICSSLLAGPAQADDSLPDALERVRASGHWYHRWCLAEWVWTRETDPNTRARIQPAEVEDLLLFRPNGVNVWPIPVQPQQTEKQRAIAAVTDHAFALQYASLALRGDKEVVLAAVAQDGLALKFASHELKNDKEVVLAAVAQNGFALGDLSSQEMINDKEVVLAAVAQNGYALQYASLALRGDKEVVLAAVAEDGFALRYASPELKKDREVVLVAVAQCGNALVYAIPELEGDKEVVLAAVVQKGLVLEYVDALRGDRQVVLAAVAQDGRALQYASPEMKNDKEVVLLAVAQVGYALRYASPEMQTDPDVVRAAGRVP